MASSCPDRILLACALALAGVGAEARDLRVCADPNNLPFSNAAGEGFENRIVALAAKDLGATLSYTWWAQRRGFLRDTILSGRCDPVPGMPVGLEMLRPTRRSYRAAFVIQGSRKARYDTGTGLQKVKPVSTI